MKNYQHWSTDTLLHERKKLVESIEEWERTLREVKSYLIVLSLTPFAAQRKRFILLRRSFVTESITKGNRIEQSQSQFEKLRVIL